MIALLLTVLGTPRASAAFTIALTQLDGNLVATVSGSANTAGLGLLVQSHTSTVIVANAGFLVIGGGGGYQVQVNNDRYSVVLTGPAAFGTSSDFLQGNTNTGDLVGLIQSASDADIYLPRNYVSNSLLSGTTTWLGQSFASLGLTTGNSYTWSWGVGANADSLTVDVVPEPSSLVLVGLGGLAVGYGIWRRRALSGLSF